jgi:hypothetical protein
MSCVLVICLQFLALGKLIHNNHDSHEFILESGTVANIYIYIYIYSATLIYCTYTYTGSRTNGNGYFRLCVADGNGKRKFLLLGRQTIYGNPQSNSANVFIYALRLFICYKSIFPISIRGDIRARTLTFHGLYRGKEAFPR